MRITVLVSDAQFSVSTGPSTQRLRWLADVACLRYDNQQGKLLGPPRGLRRQKGEEELDWDRTVGEVLKDGDAVVVVLGRDVDERVTHIGQTAAEDAEDEEDEVEDEKAEQEHDAASGPGTVRWAPDESKSDSSDDSDDDSSQQSQQEEQKEQTLP